jgi:o-succinylbenzoate synthase
MAKIKRIKTEILETSLVDADFRTVYGVEPSTKQHIMIRIENEDGISGYGEACPLPDFSGETHDVIKIMIDKYYSPILINKNLFDLELIHKELDSRYPANNTAKAAIDIALYDLIGKMLNIPIYKLLGGLYRNHVDLGAAIGMGDPEYISKKAVKYIEQGMQAIKLKVGSDIKNDIETVKQVRDRLGSSVKIRIDANAGYSPKDALKVLKHIDRWDIDYVEQPIAAWDHEGLSLLRKAVSIPIMVDESLCTIADAVTLIRREAADLFGIKLIKHGGIFKTKKITILAESNGIDCILISPWETQIGQAAGVHLALASPSFNGPHDLGTKELRDDPTIGLEESHGVIKKPKGPGLGVHYTFQDEK